jgi:hypothetical protein
MRIKEPAVSEPGLLRLAFLEELHPDLKGRTRHTGHDAWDSEGRFYLTSFPWPADADLLLTRVDVAKLKASPDFARDGEQAP